MQRAIRGKSITAITDGADGPVLHTGKKPFEIKPKHFEDNFPDDHSCGC
jgi:hypothetical protein